MKKKNTIFVQMAAYSDPELVPTVKDLFKQAKYPDRIKVCICWQHKPEEEIDELQDDDRISIIDVPHLETKGVCWARNLIQKQYDGETYTLQLDSHHRFEKNWDEICIGIMKDLKAAGYRKPILTAYMPSYDPPNDPEGRATEPWQLAFDRFTPQGAVFFKPEGIANWRTRKLPPMTRWFSAHFAFADGVMCKEVPHDPNYWFHGEEISIAARAYTHGYDLFAPHKMIAYHEFTRQYRGPKVWDDQPDKSIDLDNSSLLRNRKLFEMDGEKNDLDWGGYGFGNKRRLRDYEKYAGICFSKRAIQQETLDNTEAPNPTYESEEEWENSLCSLFKHCVDISYDSVPLDDYHFWCVVFMDENGNEIYREDASDEEIKRMKNDPDGYCKLWRTFETNKKPASWTVWPKSYSQGWCDKINGVL